MRGAVVLPMLLYYVEPVIFSRPGRRTFDSRPVSEIALLLLRVDANGGDLVINQITALGDIPLG